MACAPADCRFDVVARVAEETRRTLEGKGGSMAAQRDPYGEIAWRKSSASSNGGDCIEVAVRESFVLVRDSRDKQGVVLEVTPERWREFLDYARSELIDAANGRRSVAARPGR